MEVDEPHVREVQELHTHVEDAAHDHHAADLFVEEVTSCQTVATSKTNALGPSDASTIDYNCTHKIY